jgi:hypothetical protein
LEGTGLDGRIKSSGSEMWGHGLDGSDSG